MKKLLFSLCLACAVSGMAQFQTTAVITTLNEPVAFTFTPQNRIFITLKAGTILYYDANYTLIGTFYNLSDSVYNNFERGLLGIEIDPDYNNNQYVYVYYNHRCCNPSPSGLQYLRVVRFTQVGNVGTNPTIIFSQQVSNTIPGNHVGGNIRFRPSDPNHIYISIGELATPANAQNLANPYGKMLRINKNGSIPTNNPFYDDGIVTTGNDDRIWSYGHRNHFDFCFSTFNDSLYISENGASTWDEVNYGMRGRNYGWQLCEGQNIYASASPCVNPALTNPMTVWPAPLPSLTGILHYTSTVIPTLTNHLLVADNDYGRVYDLTLGNSPLYNTVTSNVQLMDLVAGTGGLTTLKQGSDGCFYAMKGGYTTTGSIMRVCPTGMYVSEQNLVVAYTEVVPNPSKGDFDLHFFLNSASDVGITISDVSGKLVKDAGVIAGKNGENTFKFTSTGLPAGVYFIHVMAGSENRSSKIIIEK